MYKQWRRWQKWLIIKKSDKLKGWKGYIKKYLREYIVSVKFLFGLICASLPSFCDSDKNGLFLKTYGLRIIRSEIHHLSGVWKSIKIEIIVKSWTHFFHFTNFSHFAHYLREEFKMNTKLATSRMRTGQWADIIKDWRVI